MQLFSKEGLLLLNNLLLSVAAGSVLLGTIYPLIVDAFGLPKPSVGPPWFNNTFVPLMLPALVLCAAGFSVDWRKGQAAPLRRDFLRLIPAALLLAAVLIWLSRGQFAVLWWLALSCGTLTLLAALYAVFQRVRAGQRPTRGWLGMVIAHCGLGVFALGVGLVSHADSERDVAVGPGETVHIAGYDWTLLRLETVQGPNYAADRGVLQVHRDGELIAELSPEKRLYASQPDNPMTESAVDVGLIRDLYVSLGEPLGAGRWSLRLYYKPFIRWVWGGSVLMALGGALALSDARYYRRRRRAPLSASAQVPA